MTNHLAQFKTDFKIIADEMIRLFTMSINGDESKLKQFPQRPLLEKVLRGDTVRIYLFDHENRLISFMPKIDIEKIGARLAAFELRFSLGLLKNPDAISQTLEQNKKKFDIKIPSFHLQDRDIYSVYVLGESHVLRTYSLNSSSAVIFALLFGALNTLSYDLYNLDIYLSFDESSPLKNTRNPLHRQE